MYIVAIGWLYVVLMMSLTERSAVAGVVTFLLYGVAPLALFLWIFGTPARRRRKQALSDASNVEDDSSSPQPQKIEESDEAVSNGQRDTVAPATPSLRQPNE
jgi:hypothetical protein